MSKQDRDKSKWQIRQLVKRRGELFVKPSTSTEVSDVQRSAEYQAIKKEIDNISSQYGYGIDAYAGRKCSTRKSVAERKKIMRRIKKRISNRQCFNEIARELVDK